VFSQVKQLTIRLTNQCNLNCSYCYQKHKSKETITFPILKNTIDHLHADYIKNSRTDRIFITLFGGEPLMIGSNLLSRILLYIENTLTDINHSVNLQTNTVLIDEEMAVLLSRFNVSLGVSYDGPSNERSREVKNSVILDKIELLKKYNINYTISTVINDDNINELKGITQLGANCVNFIANDYIDNLFEKAYELFLNEYINTGYTSFVEIYELFDDIINGKTNNKSTCDTMFCGAGMSMISIEPDGTETLCPNYDIPIPIKTGKDFLELKQIQKYISLIEKKNEYVKAIGCDTCYAKDICNFGCSAFYYNKNGEYGIDDKITCHIYKEIYKYLEKRKIFLTKENCSSH